MAAPIFSNASAARPGMKVVVTQRVPRHFIRDGTSNTAGIREIPRGTVGRVADTKAGRVILEIGGLKSESEVIEFKDFDFEKYFAESL